jgi:hypothetical protein
MTITNFDFSLHTLEAFDHLLMFATTASRNFCCLFALDIKDIHFS